MNVSRQIKEEIIEKGVKSACCKRAFLSGLIRSTGSIIRTDEGYGFECSTDVEDAIGYATRLFKDTYGYQATEIYSQTDKLHEREVYFVECVGEKPISILMDLSILGQSDEGDGFELRLKSNRELLAKDCCKRAFIMGVFIGGGYCTVPEVNSKSGYHLEVAFSHKVPASDFAEILASFDLFPKIVSRRNSTVVYFRSGEEIQTFLALINTPKAVLTVMNARVQKSMNNKLNRQLNCDMGNVNKQVEAAEKYLSAIKLIEETVGLASLPLDLYDVAVMRKDYPEDTYSELAERLSISKSCLNHRLRKILTISENL